MRASSRAVSMVTFGGSGCSAGGRYVSSLSPLRWLMRRWNSRLSAENCCRRRALLGCDDGSSADNVRVLEGCSCDLSRARCCASQ